MENEVIAVSQNRERMVSQLRGVAHFLFRMGKEESDDESADIFEEQGLLLTEMANRLSVPPGYAPWQVNAHINLSALVDGPIFGANFSENGRALIEDVISEAWKGIKTDDTSRFSRALRHKDRRHFTLFKSVEQHRSYSRQRRRRRYMGGHFLLEVSGASSLLPWAGRRRLSTN